ncbi:hypothetical protein PTKIN_Ptkin17bG0064900 [Pterospermum kingtungense]
MMVDERDCVVTEGGVAVNEGGDVGGPDKELAINLEIMENFGPWMLVSQKNRRMDQRQDSRGAKDQQDYLRAKDGLLDS